MKSHEVFELNKIKKIVGFLKTQDIHKIFISYFDSSIINKMDNQYIQFFRSMSVHKKFLDPILY